MGSLGPALLEAQRDGILSDRRFHLQHQLFSKPEEEINWVFMRIIPRSWYRRRVTLLPRSLNYPWKGLKRLRKPCHICVLGRLRTVTLPCPPSSATPLYNNAFSPDHDLYEWLINNYIKITEIMEGCHAAHSTLANVPSASSSFTSLRTGDCCHS